MGPAVLEIANAMGVAVGSQLSDPQLLRFCLALSILKDDGPASIPKPPGPFGLGYTYWLPWASDREDYRAELDGDWVLFAHSMEGLILLHQRERLKLVHRTNMPAKFSAVCMPHFRGDFVSLFPPRNLSTTTLNAPTSAAIEGDEEMDLTLVLSRLQTDAFPLLSVCSPTGFTAPRGALAASYVLCGSLMSNRARRANTQPSGDAQRGPHRQPLSSFSKCSLLPTRQRTEQLHPRTPDRRSRSRKTRLLSASGS
ncbi:hypothetical protein FB451DRAFT_1327516 [Mycena latifolia]|nr:hypothetical protein FB451DRAFT_1327516 [Mycena latifolia]